MVEIATLIAGAVMLICVLVIVAWQRRHSVDAPAILTSPDHPVTSPPPDISPSEALILLDSDYSTRPLRLAILDLARRGLLALEPIETADQTVDWRIERTGTPWVDLAEWESELLGAIFTRSTLHTVTFRRLASSSRLTRQVCEHITRRLQDRGWFTMSHWRHSHWGLVGSLILVGGLIATVAMVIDWLATGDLRGIIGGIFMIVAGAILASQGRQRSLLTPEAQPLVQELRAFKAHLSAFSDQDLHPNPLAQLDELLVWALALRASRPIESLAEAMSHTPDDPQLGWYPVSADHITDSLERIYPPQTGAPTALWWSIKRPH